MRKKITATEPGKKASRLLFHTSDAAREVRMTAGKDVVGISDGAEQILEISGDRFAPDAIDSVF